jgi:hypothetical protein
MYTKILPNNLSSKTTRSVYFHQGIFKSHENTKNCNLTPMGVSNVKKIIAKKFLFKNYPDK